MMTDPVTGRTKESILKIDGNSWCKGPGVGASLSD